MSYRFADGKVITSESVPPVSTDERIAWLEQRVADLELVVIAIAKGNATREEIAEKLRA